MNFIASKDGSDYNLNYNRMLLRVSGIVGSLEVSYPGISGGSDELGDIWDLKISDDGDLEVVDFVEQAIITSLFTDARASDDEVPIKEQQRGWFGNLYNVNQDRVLGSKLWLFSQSRNTNETANLIKNAAYNALKWLIEDGFLKDIQITTLKDFKKLTLNIKIITLENEINNYDFTLWEGIS